ncbi:hypothetical protein CHLRE_12g501350v5 [Chlamydomonas reinhardtii]|uniref:Uncharacterized protein n=1 Tax=Chlamydomonas reinhardtii TaxID=3055 RepID=A0A2K3D391_CHLRE|nr:uncharacterized protein CHLRE_12g501350v5 [Chlamydomonas reinhardtii]PNW74989.1 hypothetical protein CHLRE_12g501350v5 [Chlamydomonas reinhardtii]
MSTTPRRRFSSAHDAAARTLGRPLAVLFLLLIQPAPVFVGAQGTGGFPRWQFLNQFVSSPGGGNLPPRQTLWSRWQKWSAWRGANSNPSTGTTGTGTTTGTPGQADLEPLTLDSLQSIFGGIQDQLLFQDLGSPFTGPVSGGFKGAFRQPSSPSGPPGMGVGSPPGVRAPTFDKAVKEPLSGQDFQDFLDSISANLDAASITSAALNTVSGIVYTVSGALSTASVGLSLTTAVPLLFFGLFNLEVSTVAFLQGLRSDYQGMFTMELIRVLQSADQLRQRIRSGALISELEAQLQRVRQVRAMLRSIRRDSPLRVRIASAAAGATGAADSSSSSG